MGIRTSRYSMRIDKVDNEIISVQFRGEHIIIEALTETRIIPIKELNEGIIEDLQGKLFHLWELPSKTKKFGPK
jgi:hypothetical protein